VQRALVFASLPQLDELYLFEHLIAAARDAAPHVTPDLLLADLVRRCRNEQHGPRSITAAALGRALSRFSAHNARWLGSFEFAGVAARMAALDVTFRRGDARVVMTVEPGPSTRCFRSGSGWALSFRATPTECGDQGAQIAAVVAGVLERLSG
jgi:hypothetical protein